MKKKILVVGGSGFLGFNLLKRLSKLSEFEVYSLIRSQITFNNTIKKVKYIHSDIIKLNNLKKKVKKKEFHYVINLSGNIDHKKNSETFKVHFNGVKNLLKTLNIKKLRLFIQIGSCLEYGKQPSPQKESHFCNPISYYGKAKYKASSFLSKKLENYLILRPYQIYGPYQKNNRLIPWVINSCLKNKKFPCTNGSQKRDFLYIDDFTNLIIKILKKNNFKNKIYNVGSGRPIKVKKIIDLILKLTQKGKPLFGSIKMRKDELGKLYPNISSVTKDFNWKPKIKLELGLKKTISFYAKK
jgi:nucleoside-diphosphate-sugar epimerase